MTRKASLVQTDKNAFLVQKKTIMQTKKEKVNYESPVRMAKMECSN